MELKQLVFLAATAVAIPLMTWFAVRFRWAERLLVAGAFLSTSYLIDINLVSRELYRGDTRGFEFGVTDWMVVSLVLTMALSPRWRGRRLDLFPPGTLPLACYVGIAALSVAFAYVPLYGGFGLFKILRGVAVYWVAYNYLRDERDLRFLLYVFVGMVAIQFALVLGQRASGVYRAVGSTPHPNTLAVYVNLLNMVLLSFLVGGRGPRRLQWIAAGGLAMGVLIVLATFSRGALLSMALGFAIVIALSVWNGPRPRKFAVVGLLVLAALPMALRFAPQIVQRFETAPVESGLSRAQANSAALAMARDHPVGVGLNNYSYVVNNTRYAEFIPLESDRGIVHNIYLLHASELGWAGVVAFVAVIARFLWIGLAFVARRRDDLASSIAVGIVAAMLALWTQSLLEWLFRQTYVLVEFFLLAGVLAALPRVSGVARAERASRMALIRALLGRRAAEPTARTGD